MTFAAVLPQGRERGLVVAMSILFVFASFAAFGNGARGLVGAVLCPALVLLTSIDLRHRLLPNAVVFPASAAILLVIAAAAPHALLAHVEAGLALFGFLLLFALIFVGGLGYGDAKTGLLIGLALGSATAAAMFYALFGVFLAALWMLFRGGLSARKQTIAFGPFLALGAIAAFFLG
jgi:prepilin signal peptidase PulO-like enzyme (type II secretory pathway)